MKNIICCSILKKEMQYVISKRNVDIEINYLDCALHVYPDKLGEEIKKYLKDTRGTILVFGNKCCPEIEKIAKENNSYLIGAENCVEMILGPEVKEQDKLAKTFFLTGGWFENWKLLMEQTLKWDKVDARLNFGYCDRMLLINTGLIEIPEIDLLEIFDYTGLPIEEYVAGLDYFESLLVSVLK